MNRYTVTDHAGNKWERVSAQKARAAFLSGESVTICPHKVAPYGLYNFQFVINANDETHSWELQHYGARGVWDRLINSATAFNCNSVTGYYLAYYLQK